MNQAAMNTLLMSSGGRAYLVRLPTGGIAGSQGRQRFGFGRLFSEVAVPSQGSSPLSVFEHITEELLHWCIPYRLAEKEELDPFRSDKPQRWEEQEQFPKPEQERGHHQFYQQLLSMSHGGNSIERVNKYCLLCVKIGK